MTPDDFKRLQAPFPAHQVSWRLQQGGSKDGQFWARVVPYIDVRYIDERYDDVCGPAGWKVEYRETDGGSMMCGLAVLVDGEWVTKWDGTGLMKASETPGGLSTEDAKKGTYTVARRRASSAWGVGRYTGHIQSALATCYADERQGRFWGRTSKKDGEHAFSWDPPALPDWALPDGSGTPPATQHQTARAPLKAEGKAPAAGKSNDAPIPCLKCGGPQYDNRESKPSAKSPDLKCKDTRKCGAGIWMGSWGKQLMDRIEKLQKAEKVTAGNAAQAVAAVGTTDPEKMQAVHYWLLKEEEATS